MIGITNMIRISEYDPEVDAIYVQLHEDDVLDSEEIEKGIIVDYNKYNKVIGFELLGIRNISISSLQSLKSLLSSDEIAMLQEFNIFSQIFLMVF